MIRAREDRWFDRFRRTGDPRALAKVFDRTAPELWRVAVHLCRDRHAAEDAVQGAFVAALEARSDWDATRPLVPWLLGLLANRVREGRRQQAKVPDAARLTKPGERDPADLAAQQEFGAAFSAALQRLAEPFRSVLERHLVHGVAAAELAAERGVAAGTVRMQLHRGLDQLRQKLPQGFVAGGVAMAALSPESFAAMRQVVLAEVPGGSAVAAIGGPLVKKAMVAVVACLLVGLGAWSLWSGLEGGADAATGAPPVVAMTVRPFAPVPNDAAPTAPVGSDRTVAASGGTAPAKGRLRVVFRHGGTGEPVALHLQVEAGFGLDGASRVATPADVQFGETDAKGVAVFTLPVGKAKVSSSILMRGKPLEAEIVANAETELAVTLPVQLSAAVEVVDARGQPIAGARILGRTHGDVGYFVERELGRTGADGWWRQQFLDGGVPVRATCDGYVASAPADLSQKQPRRRLVLEDGPAFVCGTVFDTEGRPVPAAEVTIQPRVPGVAGERPMALVADGQGRYESAHVPPGAISVFASRQPERGRVFQAARADAEVKGHQRHEIDVRFDGGARLVVRIIGADGRPVGGQEVHVAWWPEREVCLHLAAISRLRGRTDDRGICAFDGVMPGNYEVHGYSTSWRKNEKVTLVAGQEQRCDWSLLPAIDIEVQVVDAARQPLAEWHVGLSPGVGTVLDPGHTDREGVVRFEQVADEPYVVSVRRRVGALESVRTKVVARSRNVVVVGASAVPSAAVHGAVQLPAGVAPAEVLVELTLVDQFDRGALRQALNEPGATFRFANLTAGAYEVAFRRENDSELLAMPQRVDVAPAADVDLGTIALHGSTDLRVDVACADGGKVRDLLVGVAMVERPRYFGTPRFAVDANGAAMQDMPAGRFELLVWGADIAPLFHPLVVAGAPVQVSLAPQRAVPTTFRIVGLPANEVMTTMTFRQQGVELLSQVLRESMAPVRGFLPGSYRVEVETRDGWRGAAEFTVGNAPGPEVEVRVAK